MPKFQTTFKAVVQTEIEITMNVDADSAFAAECVARHMFNKDVFNGHVVMKKPLEFVVDKLDITTTCRG